MTTKEYFAELAERLSEHGFDAQRVSATVEELKTHTAESGAEPVDEFGPTADFAAQLAARGEEAPQPEHDAERWVWTCDIYVDRELLNRFGQQGWEMERVDKLGRFVCRRTAERPMRWEYRREYVKRAERAAQAAELAPEGWEPCGSWTTLMYYRRPLSVSAGPDAELAAPPRVPARRTYFTPKVWVMLAIAVLGWLGVIVLLISVGSSPAIWCGMLVGGVIGGAVGWAAIRKDYRKGTSASLRRVTE